MILVSLVGSVLLLVISVLLLMSLRRNLELSEQLDDLAEQIEESLDIMNDCYQRVAVVADMPVYSDEPQIKQLVQDIKHVKHAIILVANRMVAFDEDDDESEGNR